MSPLCEFLKDKNVTGAPGSSSAIVKMFNRISSKFYFNTLHKDEYSQMYLSFTSDVQNIISVMRQKRDLWDAWLMIATQPEVTSNEIEKTIGRKIIIESSSLWNGGTFIEPFFQPLVLIGTSRFYSLIHRTYFYNNLYSVFTSIREKFLKVFLGEKILMPEIKEKIDESNFNIENFEPGIGADLTFLSALPLIDLLSSSGTLTAARLKKIKQVFKTSDFPKENSDDTLDRIELLVNAYIDFQQNPKNKDKVLSAPEFAKYIMTELPMEISGTKFNLFLPALKGFTKSWAQDSNVFSLTSLVKSFLKGAESGWLNLDNLKFRYLCTPTNKSGNLGYLHLFGKDARNRHSIRRKNEDDSKIEWFNEVDFPFVLNWIQVLSGVGILEIAIAKKAPKGDELKGMRFVRLTPLGRYILGFEDAYRPPRIAKDNDIEVDANNYVITLLTDNSPYSLFLPNVSEVIGKNRYKLSPESILKNCQSQDVAKLRIENLISIIDLNKHPGFKELINATEERMDCAFKMPDQFEIFRLKRNIPGLVKLLSTDPEIRKNIIFAEKGVFLVNRSFVPVLQSICALNGFLLM